MISSQHFILFLIATLTINLIPGPDMLYVISHTLAGNRTAGLLSTAAVSSGLVIHTILAATGLSLLILHSEIAFHVIKYLGAIYLIYIGVKFLFSKENAVKSFTQHSKHKIFKQGLITNLSNPKIIVFFVAFLPQFVEPSLKHVVAQLFMYGIIFVISGTIVNTLAVLTINHLKSYLSAESKFKHMQKKVSGCILILLGVKLAL